MIRPDQEGGFAIKEKVGPRFRAAMAEQIPLETIVRLYSHFVDETEVFLTLVFER